MIGMIRFLKWLLYPFLPVGLGFWLGVFWLLVVPELFSLSLWDAVEIREPFLAAFLLYAMPFVASYLTARAVCLLQSNKRRLYPGVCLVLGILVFHLLVFAVNWQDLFRCGWFGGCGTCSNGWFQGVAAGPSALAMFFALRHHLGNQEIGFLSFLRKGR